MSNLAESKIKEFVNEALDFCPEVEINLHHLHTHYKQSTGIIASYEVRLTNVTNKHIAAAVINYDTDHGSFEIIKNDEAELVSYADLLRYLFLQLFISYPEI